MEMMMQRWNDGLALMVWQRCARVLAVGTVAAGLLSACGGGGEELCAASNQSFSIDFEESQYSLAAGTESTITSKIFPESCRADMAVGVRTGAVPPGMSIVNGNLQGTPSEGGEFTVQLTITGVKGYQSQSFAPSVAPRSREITVVVN